MLGLITSCCCTGSTFVTRFVHTRAPTAQQLDLAGTRRDAEWQRNVQLRIQRQRSSASAPLLRIWSNPCAGPPIRANQGFSSCQLVKSDKYFLYRVMRAAYFPPTNAYIRAFRENQLLPSSRIFLAKWCVPVFYLVKLSYKL